MTLTARPVSEALCASGSPPVPILFPTIQKPALPKLRQLPAVQGVQPYKIGGPKRRDRKMWMQPPPKRNYYIPPVRPRRCDPDAARTIYRYSSHYHLYEERVCTCCDRRIWQRRIHNPSSVNEDDIENLDFVLLPPVRPWSFDPFDRYDNEGGFQRRRENEAYEQKYAEWERFIKQRRQERQAPTTASSDTGSEMSDLDS